jgi:hypothetical protein
MMDGQQQLLFLKTVDCLADQNCKSKGLFCLFLLFFLLNGFSCSIPQSSACDSVKVFSVSCQAMKEIQT